MNIEEIREKSRPADNSRYVGWVCSYTPEELILAAGFTPYRLLTAFDLASGSEAYLAPNLCPYVHRLFAAGLQGRYGFLDAAAFVYSCDAMRRLADMWDLYLDLGPVYTLDVPRRRDRLAKEFFRTNLLQFKDRLERLTGRQIRDEDLSNAISTVNKTRGLIRELFDLRSKNPGLVSGREVLELAKTSCIADRDKFNHHLQKLVRNLSLQRRDNPDNPGKKRIMLYGNVLEEESIYTSVEQAGGEIVWDDHCLSARHFDTLVDEAMDPWQAIAKRYLQKASCPRMQGMQERLNRILHNIHAYNCDGVIVHSLKFCDLMQSEIPRLERALQERQIEHLHVERENLAEDPGQIKTRIEAFMELLERKQ